MITQAKLKELLHYHPESGDFVRLTSTGGGGRVGHQSGSLDTGGYRQIGVGGKHYLAHRLAWMYEHGEFPPEEIDHINGVRDDNRLQNLRLATCSENMRNYPKPLTNTSGFKGVCWDKYSRKWRVQVKVNKKKLHIGMFAEMSEARSAYRAAANKYYGSFVRAE